LEPTSAQVESLLRHCGAARFVFNHVLARVLAIRAQRAAEASYGIAEDDLTPWQGWSLPGLRRTWNQVKPMVAPWWGEVSKEAFNTGLDALSRALNNWQASRSGDRKGRRVGLPRFKSRVSTGGRAGRPGAVAGRARTVPADLVAGVSVGAPGGDRTWAARSG
jgi:putative transposase